MWRKRRRHVFRKRSRRGRTLLMVLGTSALIALIWFTPWLALFPVDVELPKTEDLKGQTEQAPAQDQQPEQVSANDQPEQETVRDQPEEEEAPKDAPPPPKEEVVSNDLPLPAASPPPAVQPPSSSVSLPPPRVEEAPEYYLYPSDYWDYYEPDYYWDYWDSYEPYYYWDY